jgi:hypothetical protein
MVPPTLDDIGGVMDLVLLRPFTTQVEYQGQFSDFAFRLLANPVPIYDSFMKVFKKYGVSLRDLKFETGDFSQTNINCSLLNFNVLVRVKVEQLEVSFYRFESIGNEKAAQIVNDAWEALSRTDKGLTLSHHNVTVQMHTDLPAGLPLRAVTDRYVTTPEKFRPHAGSGVILYLGEDLPTGERGGTIVLDTSLVKQGALFVRVTGIFDAAQVPIHLIGPRMDAYLTEHLAALGLALERDG